MDDCDSVLHYAELVLLADEAYSLYQKIGFPFNYDPRRIRVYDKAKDRYMRRRQAARDFYQQWRGHRR